MTRPKASTDKRSNRARSQAGKTTSKLSRRQRNKTHYQRQIASLPTPERTPTGDELPQLDIESIESISRMSPKDMPHLISLYSDISKIEHQTDIHKCLTRLLKISHPQNNFEPHPSQVRILRCLIYCNGDVLFIARTGLGKSLILHAYSVLTGLKIIQVVPLDQLGSEQVAVISSIPGMNPCHISSATKRDDPQLIKNLETNQYTHILVSPEQLFQKEVFDILKRPDIQSTIGLFAIDECHLITEWRSFRPEFEQLGMLRYLLRDSIVWFGCSATLSEEQEDTVLKKDGFRPVGNEPQQTEVIRTSINRTDIFLSLHPIPRGKLRSFDRLYFLLDACQSPNANPRPCSIPKTVVYVDSIKLTIGAVDYLRRALVDHKGMNRAIASKSVVNFHSRVVEGDKEKRFAEFRKPDSDIRIIVATTSLGMGINIPDIDRVVIFDFPADKSVQDTWQRIGRGGRELGRVSHAFIFLPYWAFDNEGVETRPSRSHLSVVSLPGNEENSQIAGPIHQVNLWTKDDKQHRENLPLVWREIANGRCHRQPFLSYLGEGRIPPSERAGVSSVDCCSRCHPNRAPIITTAPPTRIAAIQAPTKNSRPWFASCIIEEWCTKHAQDMSSNPNRRFRNPPSLYMSTQSRYEIAYLFRNKPFVLQDVEELVKLCPTLQKWEFLEKDGLELITFLKGHVAEETMKRYQALLADRTNKRDVSKQGVLPNSEVTNLSTQDRKDDDLARLVAERKLVAKGLFMNSRPTAPDSSHETHLSSTSDEMSLGPVMQSTVTHDLSQSHHTHLTERSHDPAAPLTPRKRKARAVHFSPTWRLRYTKGDGGDGDVRKDLASQTMWELRSVSYRSDVVQSN